MMEHIRQHDWCRTVNDQSFINVADLENSVTERIIRNKFIDPLLKYDNNKEERNTEPINWDEVFNTRSRSGGKKFKTFIPALRAVPPYPKLSSLTNKEHYKCLRVLCAQNLHVLPTHQMPRPTKVEYRLFEALKEKYDTEKKEYIEWAKSLWLNGACIKALRPKPTVEVMYEAEFKMRSHAVQSFPKEYTMAAQITLRKEGSYEFKRKKDLINVDILDLPEISYPKVISTQFTVLKPCSMPEPCNKHPSRFVLPNEKSVSILPLTEVHRELAQYAMEHGASAIVGESALKCLLETDRSWILPVSVCEVLTPDGEKVNITVIGSEFAVQKEPAQRRTYRALKHMLHSVFILPEEQAKIMDKPRTSRDSEKNPVVEPEISDDDSDDDNRLLIDIKDDLNETCPPSTDMSKDKTKKNDTKKSNNIDEEMGSPSKKRPRLRSDDAYDIGIFSCMCKDTIFETPPARSFKLWELKDKDNKGLDPLSIIIHCSHKTRKEANEVILEPIPEFLIDVAGTEHSHQQQMSLALSLMLRKHTLLLNARIDANVGDLATVEEKTLKEITTDEINQTISGTVYGVFDQLSGLVPGKYVLVHEKSHGDNALLHSSGARGGGDQLSLAGEPAPRDETAHVQLPPKFAPVLLPYHKFRNILPCAFTPYEEQVVKDTKKSEKKQKKTPPSAITSQGATGKSGKYPKRKRRKGKKKNSNPDM